MTDPPHSHRSDGITASNVITIDIFLPRGQTHKGNSASNSSSAGRSASCASKAPEHAGYVSERARGADLRLVWRGPLRHVLALRSTITPPPKWSIHEHAGQFMKLNTNNSSRDHGILPQARSFLATNFTLGGAETSDRYPTH